MYDGAPSMRVSLKNERRMTMKNLTLKLLALMLVCIIVLPMMFACGDEEQTDPFLEMSEEEKAFHILSIESDDSESVCMDMELTLACKLYGMDVTAVSSAKDITIGKNSDSYVHHSVIETSTTMMGTTTVVKITTGYTDGKMYVSTDALGSTTSKWSPITKDDYIAYCDENNDSILTENFSITKENCQAITCVQLENGGWKATFAEISGDGLKEFKEMLKSFEGMVEADTLEDVTLALTVDSNRKPTNISIDFKFSGEDTPVVSLDATITTGDTVTAPSVDLTNYEEVEDLTSLVG